MSAQANLLQIYKDWRAWTESEREAILDGDWRKVKACQAAKADLQPMILRETEKAQKEFAGSGGDRTAIDKQVRSVVNELIYLESCNGEIIAEARRKGQEEMDALGCSGRNLAKIQKQYAPGRGAAWESYS
jgi:hypothetical protein